MKKELLEIKVKRIGNSPYFHEDFLELEKNKIEELSGVMMLPMDSTKVPDVVITNTHVKLNSNELVTHQDTKLIIHSNSGYDNFSFDFVKNVSAPIIIGNTIRENAVTSYILSSFYNFYSNVPSEVSWSKDRKYNRIDLSNLNILIIGNGHIGSNLKKSLTSVVKEIRIYDPFKNYPDLNLKDIDVIIPVCGLNPTSKHLINETFFNSLTRDFLLINASRGEIIDTNALIKHLKKTPNSFAYLDVYESEPNDFSIFKDLSNINLTSHIAGVFNSIDQKTIAFEKEVLFDFQNLTTDAFNEKYFEMNLKNKINHNFLI